MRVVALDHLVLTVRDIEHTIAFYERVLGMKAVTFGAGRKALSFGSQKINLHQAGKEFEPKADQPTPGSADLCFLADSPLAEVVAHLKNVGVSLVEGPVDADGGGRRDRLGLHSRSRRQPGRNRGLSAEPADRLRRITA